MNFATHIKKRLEKEIDDIKGMGKNALAEDAGKLRGLRKAIRLIDEHVESIKRDCDYWNTDYEKCMHINKAYKISDYIMLYSAYNGCGKECTHYINEISYE